MFSRAATWAASLTLAWNPSPSPTVAGYDVYYGLASGDYASNIDAGNNASATVSGLTPGLTYYFAVMAYDSSQDYSPDSIELAYTIPGPPQITLDLLSQTAIAGATAVFAVSASGTAPFTYQWFNGATAVPGATTATLTMPNVSDANAGNYSVVISNSLGSATSSVVALSVLDPPVISLQPVDQNVIAGADASFHVAVSGTPPFTIQWFDGGTAIATGTKPTLNLVNVSAAEEGNYSVVIGNSAGSVTSSVAALSVISPPVIMSQPLTQSVAAGTNVSLHVGVSGTPPFMIQWFDNGTAMAAGTKMTLRLANVSAAEAGNYYATIQNAAGAVTSATATLTVTNASTSPPITNAFAPLAGAYNGLFYQTNESILPDITVETAGLLSNCVVQTNGIYSASVSLGGFSYPLAGALDGSGDDSEVVSCAANGLSNLNVTLHLDMTGATGQITGSVSNMDAGNPWTSSLLADLATNALPVPVGSFSMLLTPPPTSQGNSPVYYGSGLLANSDAGVIVSEVVMPDGTSFSQSVPVAKDGTIPLYASLYGGLGLAEGWINLSNGVPSGSITWVRPDGLPTVNGYPPGFTMVLSVSSYKSASE